MNKTQKALLAVVMVCAIVVAVVLFSGYRSDRKVLSGLKKDLEESTATWKRINEEKLEVQKDLKEVKDALREAELIYSDAEERALELEQEIAGLEKSISEIKAQ